MNTPATLERHGEIGVVRIDNPPVNALTSGLRDALVRAFDEIARDASIKAVVLHCEGRTFIAGGDIAAFSAPDFEAGSFNALLARMEQMDRPIVAAIHGTALGGGLETALCCHYRIAASGAKVGLPEVLLGILPGSGGTQRLPRVAGAELALKMMLSGAPISAEEALRSGVIDEIVTGDLLTAALAVARRLVAERWPIRRVRDLSVPAASIKPGLLEQSAAEAAKKSQAYPAPPRIVRLVEAATRLPIDEGLQLESTLFEECRVSPQSAAMRHLFFAQREASKIPGLPANVAAREIKRVGIIGAGTMGGGIAMNIVNIGLPVVIVDANQAGLDRGLSTVRKNYEVSAARGKLTTQQLESRMALFQPTLDYQALADCDLVIEAVFEDLELKKGLCAKLGAICKPGAIIASNTSSLDVDALALASGRPANVVGMHFFSPANVMKLLEIVRGAKTSPDALFTAMQFGKRIGKIPVVSGVCYGFIGNRAIEPYMREAEFMLLEGATPAQIDVAIESLGLPMGPCRMLDLAGIDVAARASAEHRNAGHVPDPISRMLPQKLFELGRLGQKTGAGYYKYDSRKPIADPEVERICADVAAQFGIARRSDIGPEEIIERCLYSLVNEAARILDEGISYRASDIDVVFVFGYGFPDFRGGPMHMADVIGLQKIAARLDHYAQRLGNAYGYWTKADLLSRLAAEGRRFADWRKA
jgi:3-hydroxyacyl-CoA dehydrogenase